MRTLHAAPLVLPGGAAAPLAGGALLVEADRIAAIGPQAELAEAYPTARIREWPGVLTPGLRQPRAAWLLTRCYFPDPREYALLGAEVLGPRALADLAPDAARMAGSVRRGLQQMLRHGTTAVALPPGDPALTAPAARLGLRPAAPAADPGDRTESAADLDPLAAAGSLAAAVHVPLALGAPADFAVFDAPDEPALLTRGAASCVATVLGGRLLYRGR
ncbi:hypothetical protein [Streptomyces sp. NRRL S-87]|uniref:imidazolonepropionase-like domain-containing protein n=1 Tax=Streptomyces sp. NRRL S-87 TaxID=1463920 RepID=UPI0004BE88CA|nr:hypothetical protein [Streptomyces sp. NRRL S-87]